MSDKNVKTVKITENELVDLIDGIVSEAVTERKKEWIAEQEAKQESLIESRMTELEAKINLIKEGKKDK